MQSPYDVLGVPRHADETQIRAAFRRLAAECHPDRNPTDETAHQRFSDLNAAYQILSDPQKRAAYDRFGEAAFRPGGFGNAAAGVNLGDFVNLDNLFGDLLGAFGVRFPKSGDIHTKVSVSFLEAARGCERTVDYTVQDLCPRCQGNGGEPGAQRSKCGTCAGRGRVKAMAGGMLPLPIERPCPQCHGTGQRAVRDCTTCRGQGLLTVKRSRTIEIPAGIESGSTRELRGDGNRLGPERPAGNLLVEIHVEPHEFFRRSDDDVLCQMTVSFAQAALGTELTVPTISGQARLKIPAGTQPGSLLRMRGKGLPRRMRASNGDQLVEIQIEVPKSLTPRARELITSLSAELGQSSGGSADTLFGRLKRWL
jgi:molecular chaperone DnaJ